MATFKPGQRVKRIAHCVDPIPLGSIGTVTEDRGNFGVCVKWDSGISFGPPDYAYSRPTLAPLTDPGCESFLQAMRDYANKQRTPVDVLRELHGEYL
jgi:hypothetical protein